MVLIEYLLTRAVVEKGDHVERRIEYLRLGFGLILKDDKGGG